MQILVNLHFLLIYNYNLFVQHIDFFPFNNFALLLQIESFKNKFKFGLNMNIISICPKKYKIVSIMG